MIAGRAATVPVFLRGESNIGASHPALAARITNGLGFRALAKLH
jgi:hypothetical protein